MLSFKQGTPFAKVTIGGKEKTLMIHDGTETNNVGFDESKFDKLSDKDLNTIKEALDNDNGKYLTGKLKRMYNQIINEGDLGKDFYHENAAVQIIPTEDPDQRDSIYITGPSGSGKSVYVSNFIAEYKKRYPKRNIILISGKDSDPALDKYKIGRIPIDETLVEDPINLDEMVNSLVIFDDIDQLGNKKIQDAVWHLRDKILEVGRSRGISICSVAHQITNYKASRVCLNEADYVVLFCKSGARYGINYFLKKYLGLDNKQIERVMNLPSRAVVIKKTYPMCVIYQNGCFII